MGHRTTVGVGVSITGDGTTDGSDDSSHPTDAPTANTKPTTAINKDLNACPLVETIASRLYVSTSSHQYLYNLLHPLPRGRLPLNATSTTTRWKTGNASPTVR